MFFSQGCPPQQSYQRQLCIVQLYISLSRWNITKNLFSFPIQAYFSLCLVIFIITIICSTYNPLPTLQVWTKLICAGPSKVVEMPSHSGTVLLRTVNYATGEKVGSKITGEVTLEAQHICCNRFSNDGIIQSNLKEGFSHQFLVGRVRSHIYMLFG